MTRAVSPSPVASRQPPVASRLPPVASRLPPVAVHRTQPAIHAARHEHWLSKPWSPLATGRLWC